jgi:hypothetical protein
MVVRRVFPRAFVYIAAEFSVLFLLYVAMNLRKIILRIILRVEPYHSEVFVLNGAGKGIEGEPSLVSGNETSVRRGHLALQRMIMEAAERCTWKKH